MQWYEPNIQNILKHVAWYERGTKIPLNVALKKDMKMLLRNEELNIIHAVRLQTSTLKPAT